MKSPSMRIKDTLIRSGWIGGLVLFGALLWVLTGPVRDRGLLRVVNRSLVNHDETVRLDSPLSRRYAGRLSLGRWFSIADSTGNMLVFPLISGGIILPAGVLVDEQGKVERFIPLGNHGRQIFDQIPQGILGIYIRRIEADEDRITGGRR
jgi:hypothetical protein